MLLSLKSHQTQYGTFVHFQLRRWQTWFLARWCSSEWIMITHFTSVCRPQTLTHYSGRRTQQQESWLLSLMMNHITPTLKRLHWLPVRQRVTYKIATLVYNIRRSREPDYLYSIFEDCTHTRHLRSANTQRLCVPRTKLKTGERAFSIAEPRVWNALPSEVTSAESLTTFRKLLKSHLFNIAYNN